MKTLVTIVSTILLCSLFFTPNEDQPIETYFVWGVYCICAILAVKFINKAYHEWFDRD